MMKTSQTVLLKALGVILLGLGAIAPLMSQEAVQKKTVILFYGVYTQWYKFDKALAGYEIKIANAHSERVQDFPSVKDLFNAKLVILSDVNGGEFTEAQVKQIKTYVEQGGGLLVMGGPYTYGLGQFRAKGIAELLPVTLADFDLKWEQAGKELAGSGEMLQGVDFAGKPMVYWIHKVKPREGATVAMTAGDYPLLVTGTCGKGRVAVFTGTPLGLPQKGQTPFWQWDGWTKLINNVAQGVINK